MLAELVAWLKHLDPKASPALNPIDMAFAKLKAALGKAAARCIETLWAAIADAIQTFSPTECVNDFEAAGHDRK